MNVIFDPDVANKLKDRYTVLELDTVMQPALANPIVLHAVIEINNVSDMAAQIFYRETHANMIAAYKASDWQVAKDLAQLLKGQWQGEIDEFYQLVIDFSEESAKLNRIWDGIRHTIPKD